MMREKSANARAWMTLNRKCNLRCDWCYAKSTSYDNFADMTIDKAYHIIDMLSKLNIHHISLIGGEPTLYCDLINVIEYAKKHNISCGIITNGIKLANQDFLSELKNTGLHNVNLSLKGYSRENFKDSTGFDRYQQSLDAIKNLKNSNIPFSVSMVINPNNSKYFLSGVSDAIKKGATNFYLSFEFDFSVLKDSNSCFCFFDMFRMIDDFCDNYEELCRITKGNFVLHQTFPICIWKDSIIRNMQKNNQIYSSCQLLQKSGIIFDTNGNLIPCNALYDFVIGEYGKDFENSDSLQEYLNSNDICDFYKKISTYPSEECIDCRNWDVCGGGCISNWLHYDFETLIAKFNEYNNIKTIV